MDTKRQPRLQSLLKRELGGLIMREVEIPPGVLVSVSFIDLATDSKSAKIGVSVYPESYAQDIIKTLNQSAGQLHYKLIRVLNIRTVPTLNFVYDTGPENAAAVEKALMGDGVDKEA